MWNKIKEFLIKNKKILIITFVTVMAWLCFLITYDEKQQSKIQEITYNEFINLCESGDVDTVYYSKSSEYMTITLFNDETRSMDKTERDEYKYETKDKRKVLYPSYDEFRKDMLSMNVNLSIIKNSVFVDILSTFVTFLIPIFWLGILWKMMSAQTKGLDKKTILQTSNVKFEDVIGQDEILEDIKFIAKLIKDQSSSNEIGAKVPKGVLLTGAPGTGKTLIAKAIAGEAGVPFISLSGSDFKELYVGMGAKRVRDLFKIARKNSPCIVFIDEIDSIGAKRDSNKSNSEDDQTINALLKEMDGFTGREGIFILAATNHPDHLDSALIRAGRFDRQIAINPPRDWHVREDLFNHYLKNYKLSDDVDIENLAKTVSGFTGADIAMICNEAGIIAMMQEKNCIDTACLEEAIDKKVFHGNRSKKEAFKKDKEIVAYHESGHAVMTYLLNEPIARASIIGTTSGVGGAVFRQDVESFFLTDEDMIHHVMIAYAGRASEEIKFNNVTTGASNDITQATDVLINYVQKYGFDKEFGLLDMAELSKQNLIENSAMTKHLSEMSKTIYEDTVKKLEENYYLVELLAQKLLEVETLSGSEIKALFKEH